ncbi:prepilin-type N-terminal cleavage/methylation domain-containing protein [Idiomarina aquatica]|uniref:Prepilin-type N-terminal cleavage/methylation domain-containing protein n=1 Tax=Idiomarina aquatica TaxID=1327752 RepID=A0A4R6PPW8_9GAMM|nr:prepilin-type N-terminal cleavage/methylation domain-containing protein [Idiomarina aquatica]TDP40233.1 prepilin-type N-terminal cleavage/methylation domain-containing protein [Idiomarina aquatica]
MSCNRGFTLIEVLVASVILMGAIAVANAVYSNAVEATLKSRAALELNKNLPIVLANVRREVREAPTKSNGSGQVFGLSYQWTKELVEKAAPPPQFDVDERRMVRYEEKFSLWLVTLNVQYQGKTRTFELNEVTW